MAIKFKLLALVLVLSFPMAAQPKISSVEKYKQIGLVWGLLKYHHPEISSGKFNWDLKFLELAKKVEAIEKQEDLNLVILNFVNDYKIAGYPKKQKQVSREELFSKNYDYDWIESMPFTDELKARLVYLKDNALAGDFYASVGKMTNQVSFKNEVGFEGFDYTNKNHRLLLLYNFWNMNQYWNVNKYLFDNSWISYLDSMTELFLQATTKFSFAIAKAKLLSKINDSHSFLYDSSFKDSIYKYVPAFSVRNVNDSLVVTTISNKRLAKNDGVELGDIITKIDGKPVQELLESKVASLLSASNQTFLKKWSNILLFNNIDSINVDIIGHNSEKKNKYIRLYHDYEVTDKISLMAPKVDKKWSFVEPEIGYLNLESVNPKDLEEAFKEMKNSKGLIIDLRNYPKNISNNDIASYLLPEKKEFIKVLWPINKKPSLSEYGSKAPMAFIADPLWTGNKNSNYYKGKVVLLVDKTTQSNAEFIGMSIQQAPNCVTLGEQTAGSVMNVVDCVLSDKSHVYFTGRVAFYPDGGCVQRKGLKIDHFVKANTKNIREDSYLKEAIEIINKTH